MTHYDPKLLKQIFRTSNLDMSTSLTYIRGCAEALLSELIPPDEQQQILLSIAQHAYECRKILITKINVFTLITAENFSGPSEELNLESAIHGVIEGFQTNASYVAQTVDIEVEIAPDLPPLIANEQRLHYFLQILLNTLATGARHIHGRFTAQKQGTDILVTVTPLEILTHEHSELLALLVEQNGGEDAKIHEKTLQFTFQGKR